MKGFASIMVLPSGSISGHFVNPENATCLGLFGHEISCHKECSRSDESRLMNLTIISFKSKQEMSVVVQCSGGDALRFHNVQDVHGLEEQAIKAAAAGSKKKKDWKIEVSFECATLKSDRDAEEHIKKYNPSLLNQDAIVNVGTMSINGLEDLPEFKNTFVARKVKVEEQQQQAVCSTVSDIFCKPEPKAAPPAGAFRNSKVKQQKQFHQDFEDALLADGPVLQVSSFRELGIDLRSDQKMDMDSELGMLLEQELLAANQSSA